MRNIYIHVGNNIVLKNKSIIGVFDLDTATVMKSTREFLSENEKCGNVISAFEDLPRSFVVTDGKTVLSSLNTKAIIRRSDKKKIF